MTPQQEITRFFKDFNKQEHPSNSDISSALAKLSSPVRKAISMAIDEEHITKHEAHVHCSFHANTLQVLKEYRVDFDNIAQNSADLDLRTEVISQGWENYFARLHGPVYELLVKEFWRFAECDNLYVVSHVLGIKFVISEKSIAELLGLPHLQGLRVHGKESSLPAEAINLMYQEIYSDYFPEKPKKSYTVKTLQPKSRAWHKIFLGCLNPRPHSSSADFININQKYYLYCLKKGKKLCLPFIIFHYLKKLITDTRTTASSEEKKKPRYVPFGRLLSDILTENGLVQALRDAQCTTELKETTGEVLNSKNMKKISILEKVTVDPETEDPQDVIKKRMAVNGFPNWSKYDNPEAIAWYVYALELEGHDMSWFSYDDLPDFTPNMLVHKKKRKSRKRKSKEEEETEQKKKVKISTHKRTSGLSAESETSNEGTSSKPSDTLISEIIDTLEPPISTPPPTSENPTSDKPSLPLPTSEVAHSEATSAEQPTSEPIHSDSTATPPHISDTAISEPPILSKSEPIVTSPPHSYTENTSTEIILFDPKPHNLLDCINIFGLNVKKRAAELMTSSNPSPKDVKSEWEEFQQWMVDAFKQVYQSSEVDKLDCINAAYGRREDWLRKEEILRAEEDAKRAERQKIVDAQESLVIKATQETMKAAAEVKLQAETAAEVKLQAETAKNLFMNIEKELQAELIARTEAKQARRELFLKMEEQLIQLVVARDHWRNLQEPISDTSEDEEEDVTPPEVLPPRTTKNESSPESASDSRITSLEKTVEKIQETQVHMQKKIEESQAELEKRMDNQDKSNATMLSMLQTLLSRTQPPSLS